MPDVQLDREAPRALQPSPSGKRGCVEEGACARLLSPSSSVSRSALADHQGLIRSAVAPIAERLASETAAFADWARGPQPVDAASLRSAVTAVRARADELERLSLERK